MCILSLVKSNDLLIVTSNRDELRSRKNSLPPEIISLEGRDAVLARDAQAQGTWLLTDNAGRTVVLLNGAFENHVPAPPYRESRGIILLHLFQEENFKSAFLFYNLENIEPFQVIFLDKENTIQCLWDGKQKHVFQINLETPQVFFSPTLYNREQQDVKRNFFLKSFQDFNLAKSSDLFEFHTQQNEENSESNFFMNREFQTTKSITQIEITTGQTNYLHWQAWDNQRHEIKLSHAFV